MRLAVDARIMVGQYRGMGRFTRKFIEPLHRDVLALLPHGQAAEEWPCMCAGMGFYPWWEQVILPRLARACGASHLLCPNNTGPVARLRSVKKIVVIHDLIFSRPLADLPLSRSLYQDLGRLYRRWIVPWAVHHADVLVTVSEYSRNEICERFNVSPDSVQVIPNSVESDWYVEKPLDDGERKPYLLTVSGEASSKNLSGLLKGLAEMRRMGVGRDLRLRVVGVKPEFQDRFARQADSLGMGSVVKFEPFLDGSDLRRLYREAWAFVLPSFFEGFGIPVLEAMASGTPVVCSDTTSLPEVAGGAAWLFDPRRVRDMAEALAGAVAGGVERSVRARAGLARAHKFHFGEVRKQIQEFWISIE